MALVAYLGTDGADPYPIHHLTCVAVIPVGDEGGVGKGFIIHNKSL